MTAAARSGMGAGPRGTRMPARVAQTLGAAGTAGPSCIFVSASRARATESMAASSTTIMSRAKAAAAASAAAQRTAERDLAEVTATTAALRLALDAGTVRAEEAAAASEGAKLASSEGEAELLAAAIEHEVCSEGSLLCVDGCAALLPHRRIHGRGHKTSIEAMAKAAASRLPDLLPSLLGLGADLGVEESCLRALPDVAMQIPGLRSALEVQAAKQIGEAFCRRAAELEVQLAEGVDLAAAAAKSCAAAAEAEATRNQTAVKLEEAQVERRRLQDALEAARAAVRRSLTGLCPSKPTRAVEVDNPVPVVAPSAATGMAGAIMPSSTISPVTADATQNVVVAVSSVCAGPASGLLKRHRRGSTASVLDTLPQCTVGATEFYRGAASSGVLWAGGDNDVPEDDTSRERSRSPRRPRCETPLRRGRSPAATTPLKSSPVITEFQATAMKPNIESRWLAVRYNVL
eukprot:gnl/TRDRNA2_/TRDRNA2_184776_c0_seq1.p1 gnl/TRDRNA2_/TRDRNA2_184776_c0~~gnl/TRDRNA2_/TRDRNA2_184776_c0_seq1.p1  ORF type:complete len:462 (+),score=82.11 gnl/TRDRNA2_/TRDRNA2_184776_c0_seq1:90-1475(+)